MSDTPRTDAATVEIQVAYETLDGLSSYPRDYIDPDFARTLERENNYLRKLLEADEQLLEDKARLDWLYANHSIGLSHRGECNRIVFEWGFTDPDLRAAIDAARKAHP